MIDEVAGRLFEARRDGRVLDAFPGGVPVDLASAEAVQDALLPMIIDGAPPGWKIGAIQPAYAPPADANRVLGPALAVLDDEASVRALPTCLVEAEFVVILDAVPAAWTAQAVAATPHQVRIGLEICGSAVADINGLGPWAITADLGNNVATVLGPVTGLTMDAVADVPVTLSLDGVVVGTGTAASVPGGLADGIAQLGRALERRGRRLEPGTPVCTGSLAGAPPGRPGQTVRAAFGALGAVTCTLV